MNRPISVNTRAAYDSAMERAMAARLEALLRGVGWLRADQVVPAAPRSGFDLLAAVPLPGGGKAALCVECKSELRPSMFRLLTDRKIAPPGRPRLVVPVLALPWVSPRIAELCAAQGWSWFDLAGNHRLDIPGLLHLSESGHTPAQGRPRSSANLGTAAAGRVIRALLVPENAGVRWTQREIQSRCRPEVSLGLVNKVVRHLRDEAFIEVGDDGGFRLQEPQKLLLAWRDAYRFDRHGRRDYFTLLQDAKLHDALVRFGRRAGGFAAYAAFSAADFQAPHVRQPKTWLFVRERELAGFETLVEAKPVDSGGNLTVLIPEDDGVFYAADAGEKPAGRLACTNAVQTYVDLSHCGGRGGEAAEAVLEQRLKPAWEAGKRS